MLKPFKHTALKPIYGHFPMFYGHSILCLFLMGI